VKGRRKRGKLLAWLVGLAVRLLMLSDSLHQLNGVAHIYVQLRSLAKYQTALCLEVRLTASSYGPT
jgi:hypothetical protein